MTRLSLHLSNREFEMWDHEIPSLKVSTNLLEGCSIHVSLLKIPSDAFFSREGILERFLLRRILDIFLCISPDIHNWYEVWCWSKITFLLKHRAFSRLELSVRQIHYYAVWNLHGVSFVGQTNKNTERWKIFFYLFLFLFVCHSFSTVWLVIRSTLFQSSLVMLLLVKESVETWSLSKSAKSRRISWISSRCKTRSVRLYICREASVVVPQFFRTNKTVVSESR